LEDQRFEQVIDLLGAERQLDGGIAGYFALALEKADTTSEEHDAFDGEIIGREEARQEQQVASNNGQQKNHA